MGKYQVHQKDGNQDQLVDWLAGKGCVYEHLGRPVDGLLCVPVRGGWVSVPLEIKARYGKLRPSQQDFFDRWPGPRYVVKTEVECAAMLAELKYLDPKRASL